MQQDASPRVGGLDVESVMPEGLTQQFLDRSTLVRAKARQILLLQGSRSEEVYLIRQGRLKVSLFSVSGKQTILREMGPGRLVGEMAALGDKTRTASVEAIEDCQLACMSGENFRSFLQDTPGAGYWMAVQLAARVKNQTEKTVELATMSISSRVQSELLRIAAQYPEIGDRIEIRPLPTHAELAARIGTHREAVTRELRLLASEGLIEQAGRTLSIPSIEKLHSALQRGLI